MKRLLGWTWLDRFVSTFLSGLFAILPIAITVGIIGWVVGHLRSILGSDSLVGEALAKLGLQFANENLAPIIGWVFVVSGIWLLGLLTKSMARNRITGAVKAAINHIPVVKGIYGTTSQLVGMLRKDQGSDLQAMSVVFCSFGAQAGGGFLALMPSPDIYRFGEQDYRVVYVPTSPLPMSGGIVFVPVDKVTKIDMSPEQVMRMYLSLGILTSQVLPKTNLLPANGEKLEPQGQNALS
jgi:uncharacterized membrane protein